MRRWPPMIWLLNAVASVLILNGADTTYRWELLIPGLALAVIAFGLALYIAFARYDGVRPPAGIAWLVPAAAGFYVLTALAASTAGTRYAVAALAAGMIPMTAAALIVGTARTNTVKRGKRPVDGSPHAADDPFPGIGADEQTPLGDTPEHSDAERVARPDPRLARRERAPQR